MDTKSHILAAERTFFTALLTADRAALERLLADDFLLVDVMRGAENSKAALLDAVGGGMVRFESIEPAEARVRLYGDTAVVNGRTQMKMTFAGNAATVQSRYTHVFVKQQGEWRFASAQGTPIAVE
jgi:ketosteroid isomerase-like protein